jgi:serine protease Do
MKSRFLFACTAALLMPNLVAAQAPKAKAGWFSDYSAAKAEAKRTGQPIFLVFRCDPCTDSAKIDEQVVRLDKEIAEAADKFVRVRLTRIAGVDLRLFDFDYDVTWYCFFLNADEHVYGRYGGRDAGDALARISLKGLHFAMEQALQGHQNPPQPAPRPGPPQRVEDLAAAKSHRGCIHCHNVNGFRRADLKRAGQWSRDDVWAYPLAENVGLTLDVDAGNKVKAVNAQSAADKVGLKPGDLIKNINGVPVASLADASFGLHKAPAKGEAPIVWLRDGKEMTAKLELTDGWRKTNLSWRPSLFDILPTLPLSGAYLKPDEKKLLGLPGQQVVFRQDKFVHSTFKAIGMQKDDLIVGIDGKELDATTGEFLDYVRRNFLAGDQVTLNVLRDGKKLALALTLK